MSKAISKSAHEELVADLPLKKLYTFKDNKAGSYTPPMTVKNRGVLVRDIEEMSKVPDLIERYAWLKHSVDHTIFEIGEFDENTGNIRLYETKDAVGLVDDFRVKPQ